MGDGGPQLGFDIIADQRQIFVGKAFGPGGVGSDKHRDVVDKTHSGLKGAFGIKTGGLLGAHRHVVEQYLSTAIFENAHDFGLIELGQCGGHECVFIFVFPHMGGKSIQDRAHVHLDPTGRQKITKNRGAVGGSKDGFGDIFADFAFVDIKSSHHFNVTGFEAADFPVH